MNPPERCSLRQTTSAGSHFPPGETAGLTGRLARSRFAVRKKSFAPEKQGLSLLSPQHVDCHTSLPPVSSTGPWHAAELKVDRRIRAGIARTIDPACCLTSRCRDPSFGGTDGLRRETPEGTRATPLIIEATDSWHRLPGVLWLVSIVLVEAAVIDGLKQRVPNWLTFHLVLGGLAYAAWTGGLGCCSGRWRAWPGPGLAPAAVRDRRDGGGRREAPGRGRGLGRPGVTLRAFATSAVVGGLMALAMVAWSGDYIKPLGPVPDDCTRS